MPIYSYLCKKHGGFELIQGMDALKLAPCPRCKGDSPRVMSKTARIATVERERLPYGDGSRGRFISRKETGGCDILVPSFGAMEKAEVDYVAGMAIEKEKTRVAKQRESPVARKIGALIGLGYSTKSGQRARTIKEAMKELR